MILANVSAVMRLGCIVQECCFTYFKSIAKLNKVRQLFIFCFIESLKVGDDSLEHTRATASYNNRKSHDLLECFVRQFMMCIWQIMRCLMFDIEIR